MIRGYFDPTAPRPVPKVRVALSLPGNAESWAFVDFVVDTGAMITMLGPRDAVSPVGIDPADPMLLAGAQPGSIEGVGGQTTNAVVPALYGLVHTDGTVQILPGVIWVAMLTGSNGRLSSLLGWDVLQHFQLVTDFRTGQVLLRKPDRFTRTRRPRSRSVSKASGPAAS